MKHLGSCSYFRHKLPSLARPSYEHVPLGDGTEVKQCRGCGVYVVQKAEMPRLVPNTLAFGGGVNRWVHPSNTGESGGSGGYSVVLFDGDHGRMCLVRFIEVKVRGRRP